MAEPKVVKKVVMLVNQKGLEWGRKSVERKVALLGVQKAEPREHL